MTGSGHRASLVRQARSWSMRAYRSHDPSGQGPTPAWRRKQRLALAAVGEPLDPWARGSVVTAWPSVGRKGDRHDQASTALARPTGTGRPGRPSGCPTQSWDRSCRRGHRRRGRPRPCGRQGVWVRERRLSGRGAVTGLRQRRHDRGGRVHLRSRQRHLTHNRVHLHQRGLPDPHRPQLDGKHRHRHQCGWAHRRGLRGPVRRAARLCQQWRHLQQYRLPRRQRDPSHRRE